ncbi:MAG TPA: hypothetical protein VLZ06_01720 [Solirubrobacteraceae bacterium]|nr:hypothetical protein [Solirubrobacteraceae bacterium]
MSTRRSSTTVAWLVAVLLVAGATMGVMAGSAGAELIYKNMPTKHQLDGAEGFQCCGTSAFGGEVTFAGTDRGSPTITAGLLSFACEQGSDTTCTTKKNATFTWPITLEIYEAGAGESVGPLIARVTREFAIPYRPTESPKCPDEGWTKGYGKQCVVAIADNISFYLGGGFKLPSTAIIALAFNTESYGSKPTGQEGPENSLNVTVNVSYECTKENPTTHECEEWIELPTGPSVGTDPFPEQVFQSTVYSPAACGGVEGSFGASGKCWKYAQPAFQVKAKRK